ncbi:helix-turn-helix domain-containing protein [Mangrovactinospora gilvigrisea]|nr:helix-turn-helix transcriptional regulator [Mangrovactinospora gilvigrisea]
MTTHDHPLSGEALVAYNLRQIRKARRVSQDDLAELMTRRGFKMHQTQIAKMERGARPIRLDEAISLAACLGVPAEPFMSQPVGDESDPDFEFMQARFDVQVARREWEAAAEAEEETRNRYNQAIDRIYEVSQRLGMELPVEIAGGLQLLPAPGTEEYERQEAAEYEKRTGRKPPPDGQHPEAPER